ncbi:replication protein [Desulforamulus aquiferis]|uniref:Replication protein n=1 Tax=Desulforamulus aquiferis TaxID=1397668 RepID=A0AAW7ZKD1_9FIRM|nr:replication protein [Desulforamulus aquiferis]MDO7788805.1 replication protein [Desulforamulus aquiferis]
MANPQPEQFTRLSNELYTAIMQANFSKRQRKILDLVIRMSYGCGKKFALLRPMDFELVGIHKTDIGQELAHLSQAEVLFIDGEQITLNKDYECWQVGLAHSISNERWNEVLNKNLGQSRVGKILTTKDSKGGKILTTNDIQVGKTPTNDGSEVGISPTSNWCFTNQSIGKIPTTRDPEANHYKTSQLPKEKVKEIIKEKGITPQPPLRGNNGQETIKDILTRFPRYTRTQTDKLLNYWQMISRTHKNRTIPSTNVAKEMNYWERFPVGIVMEAIELHLCKYPGKNQDYTAGIMRRLLKEKGGSESGTNSQPDQITNIDWSKFLWNGGKYL